MVSRVDLPTPGSPPTSTSEPGHQPAAEHAVELATPVGRRSASAAGTSDSATGRRAMPGGRGGRPRFAAGTDSSTSDDHAPQRGSGRATWAGPRRSPGR